MLVLGGLLAAMSIAAEPAGEVRRLEGMARARLDGVTRELAARDPVFVGDLITTAAATRIEMVMLDEAVLILGDDTALRIDDYVYAPDRSDGRALMRLAGGVFKAISGALSARADAPFRVATAFATIGIRGTSFWGGQTPDRLQVVLLEGKGIYVENEAGRVDITVPGQATVVAGPDVAPTAPHRLPADELERAIRTTEFGAAE